MKGCGWYMGQSAIHRQPWPQQGKETVALINETTGSARAGFVKDGEGDIISGACFHVKDISSGQNISVCPHRVSADLKPVE